MGRFAWQAAGIFETADAVFQSGERPTPVTVLVGNNGGVRLVCNSDWPLDRLREEHGADVAYRIEPADQVLRLECRCGGRTITYESERDAERIKRVLRNRAEYALVD